MRIILIVFLLLISISVYSADNALTAFNSFQDMVRQMTRLSDTVIMPDSTLDVICSNALLWTSVDIGGVEIQGRILTVAGTPFYPIPDTVVRFTSVTLLTEDGETQGLKHWYPQYFNEKFELPALGDSDDDAAFPVAYNYGADSIQLLPTPVKVDTIYYRAYVEHPVIAAGGTISMDRAFADAALFEACNRALMAVAMFDRADKFLVRYELKKKQLLIFNQRPQDLSQLRQ